MDFERFFGNASRIKKIFENASGQKIYFPGRLFQKNFEKIF